MKRTLRKLISEAALIFGPGLVLLASCANAADVPKYGCTNVLYGATSYTVCRFDGTTGHISTALNDTNGKPLATFSKLKDAMQHRDQEVVFAMNGGMYHADRRPVGLYIEDWQKKASLNTNQGPGNFHMLPNGVFWVWQEDGHYGADVMTADNYRDKMAKEVVRFATQSGPMLVIDGKLHPKFRKDSPSKYIRNGVGLVGGDAVFVIANQPVNFYDFASVFKDELGVTNALYLDGAVSKIYAPGLDRLDLGRPMGPMIVVTKPAPQSETGKGDGR